MVLNKTNNIIKEVPGNILKQMLEKKSLQRNIYVIYDFETMIVEIEDH